MIPIRIHNSPAHKASNGPTGIDISTGTRYFAAVLLQEYYEGTRLMAWTWIPFLILSAAAIFLEPYVAALAIIWMIITTQELIPTRRMREERELMGQAIEIAAIFDFYDLPESGQEFEYRLQARSMVRVNSPYTKKGFWPRIPRIPVTVTVLEPNESIDTMVAMLKAKMPEARRYVAKHHKKLAKWRPLGAESLGY